MSGFSYHHDQSPDAPSLHNHNSFAQVLSSLQRDDANIECFEGIPFHFQSKEVNAISSIRATIGVGVPPLGLLCVLNKSKYDPQNDAGVTTQMPKRKKKVNSKAASRKNDDKRMKVEKEQQSPGTQEKGYVHVRARRGQATDSHSLAERVRREKIGERMQLLQSLVPGCDKITGKAQVLDEIINYVQSLQTQVQILMAKLYVLSPYVSGYEANLGGIIAPLATREGICRVEASLSCMLESSGNLLHFTDDSQHNSLVSASSSSSLTSQGEGDQKYFISQGTEEVPKWETDVQGQISAMDQYWLDQYLAQLE